jgi:hypothetical protein
VNSLFTYSPQEQQTINWLLFNKTKPIKKLY